MSIIGNYVRVTPNDLATMSGDLDAFKNYVSDSSGTDRHFDLDQFWDALAWLLSPSSREKAVINYQWLLLAEGEIDDVPVDASSIPTDDMELAFKGGSEKLHPKIDFGYGPASVIDVSSLKRITDALASVTDEQLADKFAPSEMLGVHPDGWQHSDPSVVSEVLTPAFHRFRDFLTFGSKSGEAVLVYFN